MNAGLTLVKWDEEVFNNDIYNNFTEKYSKLIEKHVPTKTVTIRPSDKPYITTAIRKRMRMKEKEYIKKLYAPITQKIGNSLDLFVMK